MIKDYTGRKLKVGQIVDLNMVGMYKGKVVDIVENPIILSPQQQIHPHAVIQVLMTPAIQPDERVFVYVVDEPDPKDPVVIEHESKGKGLKIIRPS